MCRNLDIDLGWAAAFFKETHTYSSILDYAKRQNTGWKNAHALSVKANLILRSSQQKMWDGDFSLLFTNALAQVGFD